MHLILQSALYYIYNNITSLLAFISHQLDPAERRYSTFDCELIAIYLAIRYIQHQLEGRGFVIFTDHKPLTFALLYKSENILPRTFRHLHYISQFTVTYVTYR